MPDSEASSEERSEISEGEIERRSSTRMIQEMFLDVDSTTARRSLDLTNFDVEQTAAQFLKGLQEQQQLEGETGLLRPAPGGNGASNGISLAGDTLPPMSLYAASKVAGEAPVRRWRELYDLDVVTVRFSDVYGRMDRETGARNRHNAPYWVCKKALAMAGTNGHGPKRKFRVAAGSLDELGWDYVDAPSVARGMVAILLSPKRLGRAVYHLALGRCVPHRELLESASGAAGCALDVELVAPEEMMAAVQGTVDVSTLADPHWLREAPLDVEPMRSKFGWEATPVDAAVKDYIEWLRIPQALAA